jgi:hypothetical protein
MVLTDEILAYENNNIGTTIKSEPDTAVFKTLQLLTVPVSVISLFVDIFLCAYVVQIDKRQSFNLC